MSALDLRLSVLAARCYLRSIDQRLPVQVESRRGKPVLVLSQSIILETLLGHRRKPSGMYVLRLDRRNVSAITRYCGVPGLQGILKW